jgi:hypothetical protein
MLVIAVAEYAMHLQITFSTFLQMSQSLLALIEFEMLCCLVNKELFAYKKITALHIPAH